MKLRGGVFGSEMAGGWVGMSEAACPAGGAATGERMAL